MNEKKLIMIILKEQYSYFIYVNVIFFFRLLFVFDLMFFFED